MAWLLSPVSFFKMASCMSTESDKHEESIGIMRESDEIEYTTRFVELPDVEDTQIVGEAGVSLL